MARRANRPPATGSPLLFGIATAQDFYGMLVDDFDDFMDEPHSARRAIHCAVSAYHLHDWVWGERLARDAALRQAIGCGDSKSEFVRWIASKVWHFLTVQEIATGSKHFRPSPAIESLKVEAPPFMFDTIGAGWGEGAWDGPVKYLTSPAPWGPKGKGYLLIDLGPEADGHQYQPAAHVLEAVVRFWRDFFRAYDAAGEPVRSSVHHEA